MTSVANYHSILKGNMRFIKDFGTSVVIWAIHNYNLCLVTKFKTAFKGATAITASIFVYMHTTPSPPRAQFSDLYWQQ